MIRFQTGKEPELWRDHQRAWLAELRAECQDPLDLQGALGTGSGLVSRGLCLGSKDEEWQLFLEMLATSQA